MVTVTCHLHLEFKAEITIYKEEKINLAKPTVIETKAKMDICRFDYSIRVMNIMQGQIQPNLWGN